MALLFPTAAQAATQTPVNTFSPTSTPLANTSNTVTYTYNTTLGVWTAAGAGGSTLSAATLAEAAAGVLTTKYSSPQTAVPKDASGMTGAAIIPGGISGGRPGTPSGGMFRYNTTLNPDTMEFYDSTQSAWIALATLPQLADVAFDSYGSLSPNTGGFSDLPVAPGFIVRNSVFVPAGYTNFVVYSSVAFAAKYNTNGVGVAAFNNVLQNGVGIGYQAMAFGNNTNLEGTQIGTTIFVSTTSAVGVSNTFTQNVAKNAPNGPVEALDSSLLVLAWTI